MRKPGRKANASGRSKGYDPHVRLHLWLMRSAAWGSLSCEARALLVELYALHNGSNNGTLFLSVREAARRINTGKSTAHEAFRDLIDRGFVLPNTKGAFTLKQRHSTTWILTEFEFAGRLATKNFMSWVSPPQKSERGPQARTDGPPRRTGDALGTR